MPFLRFVAKRFAEIVAAHQSPSRLNPASDVPIPAGAPSLSPKQGLHVVDPYDYDARLDLRLPIANPTAAMTTPVTRQANAAKNMSKAMKRPENSATNTPM
jgi:hypothetical protein